MTIRQRILAMRAELDAILAELPGDPLVAAAPAKFMSCPAFAELRGLNERTIREYCELGMPHSGEGRGRRVLVAAAIAWIDAGGPARARMARRKGGAAA